MLRDLKTFCFTVSNHIRVYSDLHMKCHHLKKLYSVIYFIFPKKKYRKSRWWYRSCEPVFANILRTHKIKRVISEISNRSLLDQKRDSLNGYYNCICRAIKKTGRILPSLTTSPVACPTCNSDSQTLMYFGKLKGYFPSTFYGT